MCQLGILKILLKNRVEMQFKKIKHTFKMYSLCILCLLSWKLDKLQRSFQSWDLSKCWIFTRYDIYYEDYTTTKIRKMERRAYNIYSLSNRIILIVLMESRDNTFVTENSHLFYYFNNSLEIWDLNQYYVI